MILKRFLFILMVFYFCSCNQSRAIQPKLVITLVVDQLRPDLLTRYNDLYKGGFRWLIDHGKWFKNTHHEHGYTATGPGHFSIGSGQYPSRVGVLGNSFYDRDLKKVVNCVEDPKAKVIGSSKGKARSYARYNTTGLGDWVKSTYPNSKIISIGGKDRTAVMLGGSKPNLALYWNYNGSFISSDYYVDSLPSWVTNFNDNLNSQTYSDSLWVKSLDDETYLKYSREDHYFGEEDSYQNDIYSPIFPIGIDENDDPKEMLMGRPWFERELLKLSKISIANESLGKDQDPDILFIGFSAMDWMIHDYGPFSQEIMDACLKLDNYLGDFIDFVDKEVGLENVMFVLTADHGGLPLPEYLKEQGEKAGRIQPNILNEALEWIDEETEEKFGKNLYSRNGVNFFINKKALKKSNAKFSDIYGIISKYLTRVDGIEKIMSRDSLLKSDAQDKISLRFKNMLHAHKSADIFPLVSPNYVYKSPYGTSHGSPYDYDTHVPLIFSQKYFKIKSSNLPSATVDIAATIAKILKVEIPSLCDGISLDL
jgi:predicted AlkP superfamily pyrophosphatase or phosphodiesterase